MQRPICCLKVIRALCVFLVLSPLTLHADTLADIYELALQNDAQLKAAEASYKALRESKAQGRSALLPQVVASGDYSETDADSERTQFDETTFDSVTFAGTSDTDRKVYSISLQQSIFNLPSWFSFKQGKELSKQAKAQFSADQQAMIVRVAEAYFNVLRAADNLQTADAEVAALQRQLEQTQQRFEVGLIAITEVHEARAVHDTAAVTQLEAKGQLGISYEALTVLTGEPHSNLWQLDEKFPISKPAPTKRAEWVDFALQNNFVLQAAKYAAEASHHNAKSKKSEHLPKLSGSYSYNDSVDSGDFEVENGLRFPQDAKNEGGTLSLNLELPLFTGGFTSSARRQAYQEYIQSRETFINTQRNTVQGARSLHLTVVTDVGKVKARNLAITSAQSALDATQAGYEVGTRNIVDVLESQRFLYRALFDYSNARYDYVINMLKLKEQAGMLSPEDIYALNKWLQQPKPSSAKNTATIADEHSSPKVTTVPEGDDDNLATATTKTTDELLFKFTKDCWIEIYDADEKLLIAETRDAGNTLQLNGKSPFKVLVGYSREVTLRFNDHPAEIEKIDGSASTLFSVERGDDSVASTVTTIQR